MHHHLRGELDLAQMQDLAVPSDPTDDGRRYVSHFK